jgi:hypothetical protein
MPQFLSHGFGNPPTRSFLLSFMAASFVAAFLPFPPVCLSTLPYLWDLVPTSGLRLPDPSYLWSSPSDLSDAFQSFLGLFMSAFLFVLIVLLLSKHSHPIRSYCLPLHTHMLPSDPISDLIISSSCVFVLIVISYFPRTSLQIHTYNKLFEFVHSM